MKIVKYLFLLLLLAAVAGAVFIATQNGKYDVTQELVIKAPKNVVYSFVNDYKNWENSGILTRDTTAVYTFSDNTTGVGTYTNWELNNKTGNVKTINAAVNDSIYQNAELNGLQSEVYWFFKDTLKEATKVTLRMKGHLTFMEKANAILKGGADEKASKLLNHSLNRINYILVNRINFFEIKVDEIVIRESAYYIGDSTTCKISEMPQKIAEMFPKLQEFVTSNNIATKGKPFTYFHTFDTDKGLTSFTVCIPLEDEMLISDGSEFKAGKINRFNALKTTLKGNYKHLRKAWDAAFKHIADNKLEENFEQPYLEVYTKGPADTKDPSQWVTDIYIPIGPALPEEVVIEVQDSTATVTAVAPTTNTTVRKPATVKKKPEVMSINAQPAAAQPTATLPKTPKKDTATAKKKTVEDTTTKP